MGTHQILLKSPMIVDLAIRDDSLARHPDLQESGRSLQESILRNLSVNRQRDSMGLGTSILALSFRASDPEDASEVLDAILKAYRKTLAEVYSRTTDDTRDMFLRARDGLHRELLQKETAYQDFRKKSPLLWKGKDGVNPHQERLTNLETKRVTLALQKAETQGKLTAAPESPAAPASIGGGGGRPVASDLAKPEVESVRQNQTGRWQEQVLLLVQQEQKLLERLGEDHPEVQAVRQSLKTARAFLNQPAAAAEGTKSLAVFDPVRSRIASLKQELEQLRATETLVANLCRQETDAASKLSGYEVEDEMHRNDLQRTQLLFETLLKRLQDANIAKDSGGFEARVIAEPGFDGVKKVQPSGLLFGSAGLLLGLLLGAGFVAMAELRDRRFRDPEAIRSALDLPILGRVPRLIRRRSLAHAVKSALAGREQPSRHESLPSAESGRRSRPLSATTRSSRVVQTPCPATVRRPSRPISPSLSRIPENEWFSSRRT